MKRLVYAPTAYAYIKNSDNVIHDVTPYIVSGTVTRKIDQVSSATLELRNPNRIFTNPHKGVVFTPMDPITIFLQRLKDKPVQVFTGFLDKTPYYQMYPGTIKIEASCTLKKLLYSFFDLGLPYSQAFLSKYGWIRSADGTVMNAQGLDNPGNAPQGTGKGVLIIGDSLSVGADNPLRNQLKNYTIKTIAKVGEHTSQGVLDLQNLAGTLPGTVVVALGTNDDPTQVGQFRSELNKIVNIVGPNRHLIFVNVSDTNENFKAFNKAISDVVDNNTNASLVDWDQMVSSGDISLTDGVHPGNDGYDKRAQAIADVITGKNSDKAQTGDGTDLSSLNPLTDNQATAAASGISDLLIATLVEIANWKENRIYIESLPSDLPQRMANLYNSMAADNKAATEEFTKLMKNMIGSGSLGSGGARDGSAVPSTGEVRNEDKIVQTMYDISTKYHIPPEMTIATWLIEWPGLKDTPGNAHYGYFQWDSKSGPPGSYQGAGVTQSKPNGCYDLGFATDSYCQAAVGYAKKDSSLRGDTLAWTMRIQGVNGGNNPLYPQTWNSKISQAKGLISKYVNSSSSTDNSTPDKTTQAKKKKTNKAAERTLPHNSMNSGKGGWTQVANQGTSHDGMKPAILNLCEQLFALGFSCTAAGPPGHHLTGGFHDIKEAADWGDSVNNLTQLGEILYPLRDKLDELWIPPGYAHNGFYKFGSEGGSDADAHIHVALTKPINLATGEQGPGSTDNKGTSSGAAGSDSGSGGGSSDGSMTADDVLSTAKATSWVSFLEVPSMTDSIESIALTGQKSLMNDKPLMPFIQQMTQASLRSFMSLPNGDFFAFYPDYFGELNHHKPYWLIDDLEVLEGGIDLTDDNLVTHMYVVGNTQNPIGDGTQLANDLMSSGVVNVFNAFGSNIVGSSKDNAQANAQAMPNLIGVKHLMRKDQAIAFLQRYGARPVLEEMPMIKNHFYEMFLAYQKFMQGWSRQFQTPFSFTFMPEIFPGGKVGFPDHSLQMFVEEVTHTFDYTNGFFTDATLSSPSLWQDSSVPTQNADLLPANMVEAILTPAMINPADIPPHPQIPQSTHPGSVKPAGSLTTWNWGQKETNPAWGP